MIRRIVKALKNPRMLVSYLVENFHLFDKMDDEKYLKMLWRIRFSSSLDLSNPQTFTEKLQWLKIHDRKPFYTSIVDKSLVKDYVAQKIGEDYIIPTLGIWNTPEEIEWDKLPRQFVLKTTNGSDSSGVVICKDINNFDKKEACKKLNKSLKGNVYYSLREWPYKNVIGRIIAEKYLSDLSEEDVSEKAQLRDYKFYCFSGIPKFMLIASNRFTAHNFNYFDMNFNKINLVSSVGNQSEEDFEKPSNFEEMKRVASILSKDFAHIRVDLYSCGGKVYFGELTFYDSSGYDDFSSSEWNLQCGKLINLQNIDANIGKSNNYSWGG